MEHPENFCGMHFFNPVHKMPLVGSIRGSRQSDETIATVVSMLQSWEKHRLLSMTATGSWLTAYCSPILLVSNCW